MKRSILFLLLTFALLYPVQGHTQTAEVGLAWDYNVVGSTTLPRNPEDATILTGFQIYLGTQPRGTAVPPSGYSSTVLFDCVTTPQGVYGANLSSVNCSVICGAPGTGSNVNEDPQSAACGVRIGNLVEGQTYYMSATAYERLDSASPPTLIESPYANEVSYTVPTTQFPGTIINTGSSTKGVTVTGPTSIPRGSTATYTITMTEGYRCINVIVNGTKYACLPDPVFVFNVPNVQSAVTISVKVSPAKPKNVRIVP